MAFKSPSLSREHILVQYLGSSGWSVGTSAVETCAKTPATLKLKGTRLRRRLNSRPLLFNALVHHLLHDSNPPRSTASAGTVLQEVETTEEKSKTSWSMSIFCICTSCCSQLTSKADTDISCSDAGSSGGRFGKYGQHVGASIA